MSEKIQTSEIKNLIANITKEKNLNNVFSDETLKKITNQVIKKLEIEKFKKLTSNQISEAVPSGGYNPMSPDGGPKSDFPTTAPSGAVSFPHAEDIETMESNNNSGNTTSDIPDPAINNIVPATDLNQPKMGMAYTPELPSFMDKIEPAKVIVFSQNELSEGAENLAKKPLRTFSDPDVKKSINEFWLEEGKRKADVYLAKLEKVGQLEFDYANGTAKFVEQRFNPDFTVQSQYKENPYKEPILPIEKEETPGELKNMEEFIKNSPDFQSLMSDMVKKIIHDYKTTNHAVAGLDPVTQFSESKKTNLKMIELVDEKGSFVKETTPAHLIESIQKGDKKNLISESDEVQEWDVDGKKYFFPKNPLSVKKCYVKK